MGLAKVCGLFVLLVIESVLCQNFQVPYGLRGFGQTGGSSNIGDQHGGGGVPVFPREEDLQNLEYQGGSDSVFLGNNVLNFGSQGTFPSPQDTFPGQQGTFPGRTYDDLGSNVIFSPNVLDFDGDLPDQTDFVSPQRPSFVGFQGQEIISPARGTNLLQVRFVGDSDPARVPTRPYFQPLESSFSEQIFTGQTFAGTLGDITLTRTVTEDRYVTTTDVEFVELPATATIFSVLEENVVTTVVVPAPANRRVVVDSRLVTRAPVTYTVTDVISEFQFVTRTQLQHVLLTHTSYRFSRETLITTVTRVQTIPTTVTRTSVTTFTSRITENRIVTSTVVKPYYN